MSYAATRAEWDRARRLIRHILREPTRFDVALRRMTHLRAFVEIGPHPVLAALVPGAIGSMRRKRSQVETFAAALAQVSAASPERRCDSTRASSGSEPTAATAAGRNAFQRASVSAG